MHTKHRNPIGRLAFAAALLLALTAKSPAALKTGQVLPELSSFKLEGKLPDSVKDKVVLLDFWASWCDPCKASFPAMDELQAKFGAKGFVVIAVNVDEKKSDMEDFLRTHSASFTVVRDAAQKLVNEAGIATMPSSFLIDRQGKIRFAHAGFHGDETKKEYEKEIESLLQK